MKGDGLLLILSAEMLRMIILCTSFYCGRELALNRSIFVFPGRDIIGVLLKLAGGTGHAVQA